MLWFRPFFFGCGVGPLKRPGGLEPGSSWIYGRAGDVTASDEVQKPTWEAFGEACTHGTSQSPIDIVTASVQLGTDATANGGLQLKKKFPLPSGDDMKKWFPGLDRYVSA